MTGAILRRVLATAMLLLLLAVAAGAAEGRWRRFFRSKSDPQWATVRHDGVERSLVWYAGTGIGSQPAPVILVLHGGGGNAIQVWAGDDGQAWRRLADEHGLILLLPEGRADPGKPDSHHWNDCRRDVLEPEAASDADDVGFLRAAVDWAAARWSVDRNRIMVTGASNGGMMAYRLAMQAPDLVAATAAINANLPDPSECPGPYRPVPMLIMNGTADPLMPWDGGCVAGPACRRGTVLSTEQTVAFWVALNRTDTTPICRDLPDTDPHDGSTVERCTWDNGVAGSEVILYRIDGGGHAPPGPDALPLWYRLIAGPKNHDISAPDEIWSFFKRHRKSNPQPRHPGGRR